MGDRSTLTLEESTHIAVEPEKGGGEKGVDSAPGFAGGASTHAVRCEQVVFTSIRTPTGEGYRVIAASPGTRGEDKVEITRRSPSHQGLSGVGNNATALVCYPLPDRRYAVSYCCYAGTEHTARGGQRVYTHVAVLDEQAFASAGHDAVRVHAALGRWLVRTGPILKPPPQLAPLSLDLPAMSAATGWPIHCRAMGGGTMMDSRTGVRGEQAPAPFSVIATPSVARAMHESRTCGEIGPFTAPKTAGEEWVWATAGQLLAGNRMILAGRGASLDLLHAVLFVLPVGLRRNMSTSCGLTYSPARQMDLVLLPDADAQLRRRIVGQDTALCLLENQPPGIEPAWADWLALLQQLSSEGRLAEIRQLTAIAGEDWSSEALGRLTAEYRAGA